jgi:hypothetical protein
LADGQGSDGARCNQDLYSQSDQLGGHLRQDLRLALRKSPLDGQVLALDPAELVELIYERVVLSLTRKAPGSAQKPDAPHLR